MFVLTITILLQGQVCVGSSCQNAGVVPITMDFVTIEKSARVPDDAIPLS